MSGRYELQAHDSAGCVRDKAEVMVAVEDDGVVHHGVGRDEAGERSCRTDQSVIPEGVLDVQRLNRGWVLQRG